jgi:energy-coupling factor transporter ATP-binding protein EcfA2
MLKQFKYWERDDTGAEWEIEPLAFASFNLIIGRNATGKTRLLKAIARVAAELSGEAAATARSFQYDLAGDDSTPEARAEWDRRAQYFPFAGRMNFKTTSAAGTAAKLELPHTYKHGLAILGAPFTQRVLQWMREVGYALDEINVLAARAASLDLYVKEAKRPATTPLRRLSQGQQRALTLLTFLALIEAEQKPTTVLIDDFAEGLDFEHARLFTDFLLKLSAASPLQFIVATNDRYVMNAVPLEHWTVLVENGNRTRVFNYANSKQKFDDFKFTGLNNFDFFSMDFPGSTAPGA